MVPATLDVRERSPVRESDPVFGVTTGLYLGFLASPFVLAVLARFVADTLVTLYVAFLVTVVVAVALCWVGLGRRPGVPVDLGATRWPWLCPLAGLGLAAAGFASVSGPGVFGIVGFFSGALAGLLGVVVAGLTATRHAGAVLASAPGARTWEAAWPDPTRTRIEYGGLALVVVGGLVMLAGFLGPGFETWYPGQVLVLVGVVAPAQTREREFTATEAGLVVRFVGGFARVRPWDGFDGYSVTDAAVRLHRPRRVDYRCACSDIEDRSAVEAALDRHLDRVEPASV